jgi:hypothetical protein
VEVARGESNVDIDSRSALDEGSAVQATSSHRYAGSRKGIAQLTLPLRIAYRQENP